MLLKKNDLYYLTGKKSDNFVGAADNFDGLAAYLLSVTEPSDIVPGARAPSFDFLRKKTFT